MFSNSKKIKKSWEVIGHFWIACQPNLYFEYLSFSWIFYPYRVSQHIQWFLE